MQTEYHTWHSPSLGHGIELKVYGWHGKPMLVFPSSKGRFYEYENFGMIEACRPFIEAGKIKVVAVDGIDWQSWWNESAHPADRARRHQDYDACIVREVAPFIDGHCHGRGFPLIATGCSFGAYHAANFYLRHPDLFDTAICLSGIYSLARFTNGYFDENFYFNDPTSYVPNLSDAWFFERYREGKIILCVGQGAWEAPCIEETRRFASILAERGIPHWLDVWGYEAYHDWPWWQRQIAYFLGTLGL